MEQLTQKLKNGEMKILEVPFPALTEGNLLIRNHYSVISAGTESKTVKDARLGYIGKAKSRQKELKQVIDSIKTQGLLNTYNIVMNKLDAPAGLGYSCAGEVIAIGKNVSGFRVGDFVVCGGASANHAEIVSVPKNLCAKIPEGVKIEQAVFATIAAIALQGIRQADLKLGENCVIIGLGLLGQLTIQLLNAAGVKTIGIDVDSAQVEIAKQNGCSLALTRSNEGVKESVLSFTQGFGTDAVIITAGTNSIDPVELAGAVSRKKGKVVIVGAVPTGFSRENYFKKELDLRMSSSYGPGRYEMNYEEKGLDYPIGYVRWTENRNLQAYLDLLQAGKLNIEKLITHTFNLEEAEKAYQLILEKKEPFLGVLLKYNTEETIKEKIIHKDFSAQKKTNEVLCGFIGAGSFAQNFLLPNLKNKCRFVGVATARPNNARNIADKYGFNYSTGDAEEIIKDQNINTVFIATRHNLHYEYVIKALKAGKNVFVEKPLCMDETELEEIRKVYNDGNSKLIVGFNRRFAPSIVKVMNVYNPKIPKAINYRINAGIIPAGHWIQDKEIGGGRIVGEVCHFIDLSSFIAGSSITEVSASLLDDKKNLDDSITINLQFQDGSIANISYFSNGSKLIPKERIEIFSAGTVSVIDDFKTLKIYSSKEKVYKLSNQDKGHSKEVTMFVDSILNGSPAPISFEEIYQSTLATFKVIESFINRRTIVL